MKLATLRSGRVVVVRDGQYLSVDILDGWQRDVSMVDVIAYLHRSGSAPVDLVLSDDPVPVSAEDLAPPIAAPSKIWAAASNYDRGTSDINGQRGRGISPDKDKTKREILDMCFMKPPSAICGPGDSILVPKGAKTIFPEIELCAVIGRRCRGITVEQALSAIFGYTILVDVTAREYGPNKNGRATRCIRKGYDTFAPIGPHIVTADEIPDPQSLSMNLWVNGEQRQAASTSAMINTVAEVVSFVSTVCTLVPGDLISTGNPDSPSFQDRLLPSDVVRTEIEGIGSMQLSVAAQSDLSNLVEV